ncbi:MAG: carboxypeptidase regulatory-like domain-containing protein [Akkermansiaceae bacterium]|nr:carboxypeptidase regulatory-like domain-containing protein [Akkermansiaceae bacterium]
MNASGAASSAGFPAAALDAGAFLTRHPELAVWCMGAVKSSVIVLMVLILAALFRGGSAVARCWILRLALPALLLTALWPFGSGRLPVLSVHVAVPAVTAGEVVRADIPVIPPEAGMEDHIPEGMDSPAEFVMPQEVPVIPEMEEAGAFPDTASPPAAGLPAITAPSRNSVSGWLEAHLLSLWSGGAALVALWLVFRNLTGLLWLHRRGEPADGMMAGIGDRLTDSLRMRRAIYRRVPGLASPLLTGWFRARLWLPEGMSAMPESQIRAILRHELAHHRRRDLWWQMLASAACAIWWWNPAVWSLGKRLRHEAELAADEAVVSGGGAAADYAELLVRVASGWTAGDARAMRRTGVPMMGSSAIERRVRAILAENPFRNRMGRAAGVAVAFIALMGAGIASLTAVARPAESPLVKAEDAWDVEPEGTLDVTRELVERLRSPQWGPPDYLDPPGTDFGREFERLLSERLHSRPMDLSDLDERQRLMTDYYLNGRYVGSEAADLIRPRVKVITREGPQPKEARIRFIHARTGQPVPGLKFHLGFNGGRPSQVAADGDGRYVFTPSPETLEKESTPERIGWAGTERLGILVTDSGFVLDQVDTLRHSWDREIEVRVEPARSISGRVAGEDGQPVAGATVRTHGPLSDYVLMARLPRPSGTKTDDDGRWRLEGFPEDLGKLGLEISHPAYLAFRGGAASVPGGAEALRNGTATVVLKNGPRIHGRVVDGNGRPVHGARINPRATSSPRGAITDGDGRFVLTGLRGKYALLTIEADGFSPSQEGVMMGGEKEHVFTLSPPTLFRGRVVREDGRPDAGVEVRVELWRNQRTLGYRTRTDEDGRFTWDSAPPEPFTFNIGEGEWIMSGYPIARPDEEAVIVMKPALRIKATAVDDATGEPVRNFRVTPVTANPWVYRDTLASLGGKLEWESYRFDREGIRFRVEADGFESLFTDAHPTRQQKVEVVWRLKRK